jgi:transcriptional regulatory protein LevR
MDKIKHITAIILTAVLLPLMDKMSKFCFGNTMKNAIIEDMEKFFGSRAEAIIAEADKRRNIVKICFTVETEADKLNEIESTALSVKIANALADFDYTQHEVVKSKTGQGYAHTYTMLVIAKS